LAHFTSAAGDAGGTVAAFPTFFIIEKPDEKQTALVP